MHRLRWTRTKHLEKPKRQLKINISGILGIRILTAVDTYLNPNRLMPSTTGNIESGHASTPTPTRRTFLQPQLHAYPARNYRRSHANRRVGQRRWPSRRRRLQGCRNRTRRKPVRMCFVEFYLDREYVFSKCVVTPTIC